MQKGFSRKKVENNLSYDAGHNQRLRRHVLLMSQTKPKSTFWLLFPTFAHRHLPTARWPPHRPQTPLYFLPPPRAQAHPQSRLPMHSFTEHRPCPTDAPNKNTMHFISPSKRTLSSALRILTLKLFLKKKPSYSWHLWILYSDNSSAYLTPNPVNCNNLWSN